MVKWACRKVLFELSLMKETSNSVAVLESALDKFKSAVNSNPNDLDACIGFGDALIRRAIILEWPNDEIKNYLGLAGARIHDS